MKTRTLSPGFATRRLPWLLPLLVLAGAPQGAAGEISYSGSPTMCSAILYDGAIAAFGKKTGITLKVKDFQTGSGKALDKLFRGEADVIGMGRELKREEVARGATGHLLGHDALAVWVNAANPVRKISTAQLGLLLTGAITDWEELGGDTRPVQAYLQPLSDPRATLEILQERVIRGRPLGPKVDTRYVNPRDQMIAVAREKGSFCVASLGLLGTIDPALAAQVRALPLDGVAPSRESTASGAYPLARPLYLATLGPPRGETLRFIEFMLGAEGQAIVGKGFTPARDQDELTYSGSSTLALNVLFDGALHAFEAKTGLRFNRLDLSTSGPQGTQDVGEGKATVGGTGRPLKPEEKAQGLVEHLIGNDSIALWVHRGNPVQNLTRQQAKDILTGKTRNWKEVGGQDLPIVLMLAPPGTRTGPRDLAALILLGKEPYRQDARSVVLPQEQVQEVGREQGGICLTGGALKPLLEPALQEKVKTLSLDGFPPTLENVRQGSYPLVAGVYLVTKGEPAGKVKAFVDFMLSPEGQSFVAKSFVPAR